MNQEQRDASIQKALRVTKPISDKASDHMDTFKLLLADMSDDLDAAERLRCLAGMMKQISFEQSKILGDI